VREATVERSTSDIALKVGAHEVGQACTLEAMLHGRVEGAQVLAHQTVKGLLFRLPAGVDEARGAGACEHRQVGDGTVHELLVDAPASFGAVHVDPVRERRRGLDVDARHLLIADAARARRVDPRPDRPVAVEKDGKVRTPPKGHSRRAMPSRPTIEPDGRFGGSGFSRR